MKKRVYETCDLMHGNICVSEPCICKGMHMAAMRAKKGDIKICMTCGSTKDLLKCNSGTSLTRYECAKCRGVDKFKIT